MKIFSPEARPCDILDSEMEEMLEYYISSGTFGTQAHMVENNAKDLSGDKGVTFITKIKYIWQRVFPDMSYYNLNYPRASKLIFTIPMLWFARFFRGIKNRKTHKGEIEHLNKL
jgi:hypothetical protein